MFQERPTSVRRYVTALRKRVRKWANNEINKLDRGSCILLDLKFAEQWLEQDEVQWAWGCVNNARKLAHKLGIMRRPVAV